MDLHTGDNGVGGDGYCDEDQPCCAADTDCAGDDEPGSGDPRPGQEDDVPDVSDGPAGCTCDDGCDLRGDCCSDCEAAPSRPTGTLVGSCTVTPGGLDGTASLGPVFGLGLLALPLARRRRHR